MKITTALFGVALATGLVATAPSAMAATAPAAHSSVARSSATATPAAAEGCAGDVCMYLNTPSGGSDSAHAWLYSTTYGGYFVFTGPNGLRRQSATQTWYGGGANGTNYYPGSFSAVVGQYCFQFFQVVSGHTYSQGKACENIA